LKGWAVIASARQQFSAWLRTMNEPSRGEPARQRGVCGQKKDRRFTTVVSAAILTFGEVAALRQVQACGAKWEAYVAAGGPGCGPRMSRSRRGQRVWERPYEIIVGYSTIHKVNAMDKAGVERGARAQQGDRLRCGGEGDPQRRRWPVVRTLARLCITKPLRTPRPSEATPRSGP